MAYKTLKELLQDWQLFQLKLRLERVAYRMGRDKKANTARLIIFDEAFSKMDGERIEKSILLLRKIGFQVILSTPTEKAGDIAPWVDRILLVLRSGKTSQVTVFDKERIGELIDE